MKALIYLLQVSACTGIFYAFYFVLLRRLTFFTLNRWYLLTTLLISFTIPALTFTVDREIALPAMQPIVYVQQGEPQLQGAAAVPRMAPESVPFDWMNVVQAVYFVVALISMIHLCYTLFNFLRRTRGQQLMQIGNVKILKATKELGNSSFLNTVFINDEELNDSEIKQIITHELLHVKLWHSADRLFVRLVQVVLWFNPFANCYIRSIEENHEFEVDRMASSRDDRGVYAQLLFKLAVSGQSSLFHSFSKVPLKQRISMLFNKPTSNMKKIIYVLILPVVVVSCLAFSTIKGNAPKAKLSTAALDEKEGEVSISVDTANEINKYRQRIRRNGKEVTEEMAQNRKARIAFFNSEEFKAKRALADKVSGKTETFKVLGVADTTYRMFLGRTIGYKVSHNGDEYLLASKPGRYAISGLLQPGDEIKVEVGNTLFGREPLVVINPLSLEKNGKVIYNLGKEDREIPKNAFLWEANAVRFTDGKLTNVKKYANGNLKSGVVEVDGGFKIKFNIKPSAPSFEDIKAGDHVRLRFVHEVKTGAKEYTVNDWVSLSTDINDYGVKNPDYFYKFYQKV